MNVEPKKSEEGEIIVKDRIRREEQIRLNWSANWEWYVELFRERAKAISDYKKSSPKALAMCSSEESDPRQVLPFPETTSGEYGWLASKKEFELEVFGSYFESNKMAANAPSCIFYSTSDP